MAVDIFFTIDGIKGESMDSKNTDAIDVLSWSWGASQSGTTHQGGGGGSGKVSVQDISFTKYTDAATNALLLACCNGEHIKKAVLLMRKAGKDPLDYLKITFEDLIVSSFQTGATPKEERQTEQISLNFAKFSLEYTPQSNTGGGKGGPKTAGWNIPGNIKA